MSVLFVIATLLFIVVAVAMVLIILVQRPQGGGLASAFGGAGGGGTETAFGGRTGDVLTMTTTGAFVIYLILAMVLNISDNRANHAVAAPPAIESPATAPESNPGITPVETVAEFDVFETPAPSNAPPAASVPAAPVQPDMTAPANGAGTTGGDDAPAASPGETSPPAGGDGA